MKPARDFERVGSLVGAMLDAGGGTGAAVVASAPVGIGAYGTVVGITT